MNMMNMMKQAQQMQARMQQLQESLGTYEVAGQSGGGAVEVKLDGKYGPKSVKIAPGAVDPQDMEMLEDLLLAAMSDAKGKVDALIAEKTREALGGLNMPSGFKLPGQ